MVLNASDIRKLTQKIKGGEEKIAIFCLFLRLIFARMCEEQTMFCKISLTTADDFSANVYKLLSASVDGLIIITLTQK